MPRKRTADIIAEEQRQYEEAQRHEAGAAVAVAEDEQAQPEKVRICSDCGATEGVPDPRCEFADLCPACADQLDNAVDAARMAADDVHTEKTDRFVRRPFSDETRAAYIEQLTKATIRIKELQDEKRAVSKDFNDRISGRQQEAIAAAKALTDGGTHEMTPCECIWDYAARTYTERTIDGYVVTERPLTTEEIERFQQMHLPGFERPKGSWLAGAQAPPPASPDEDDDDEDEEDPELDRMLDEEAMAEADDELEGEDDPDAA